MEQREGGGDSERSAILTGFWGDVSTTRKLYPSNARARLDGMRQPQLNTVAGFWVQDGGALGPLRVVVISQLGADTGD